MSFLGEGNDMHLSKRVVAVVACLVAVVGAAEDRQGPGFQVIVSVSNPLTSIERERLARIFIKSETRWENGREIAVVDQSGRSPVRLNFSRDVLKTVGMSRMSAIQSYWQQQLFSGRGSPPPIKATDTEVRDFVAENPSAIGYVAADAELDGVKALTITSGKK